MAHAHRLLHVFYLEPEKARRELIGLFEKHSGRMTQVAAELGVKYDTVYRWVTLFDVEKKVDAIVARAKASGDWSSAVASTQPTGPREWEVIDGSDRRVGTYATSEKAEERRALLRDARASGARVVSGDAEIEECESAAEARERAAALRKAVVRRRKMSEKEVEKSKKLAARSRRQKREGRAA